MKLTTTSSGKSAKLAGTPSKAGTYSFKLTVTDANGASISKTYKVIIAEDDETEFEISAIKAKQASTSGTAIKANNVMTALAPVTIRYYGTIYTSLEVVSSDIISQGTGRDEDLVEVKADKPVSFIIGEWLDKNGSKVEVMAKDINIYIDEKFIEDISVSDEGMFTLPAEMIQDDFKIQAICGELKTIELYISVMK